MTVIQNQWEEKKRKKKAALKTTKQDSAPHVTITFTNQNYSKTLRGIRK